MKFKYNLVNSKFLAYFFQINHIKEQIIKNSQRLEITSICLEEIKEVETFIPLFSEQQKIALILSRVDTNTQKNYECKKEIKTLKKGLMQNLLTRKIRVKA